MRNELREFHSFFGEKLKDDVVDLSPEKALDEWREQHPDPDEVVEETIAIQEALDDMANGDRGRPADEVIAEIRACIRSSKH